MKKDNIFGGLVLTVSALALGSIFSPPVLSQQRKFFCGTDKGVPATMVSTGNNQNVAIIRWVSGAFNDAGYDNKTRCEMISNRFQSFSDKGSLKVITTGRHPSNGLPIICALKDKTVPCNGDSQLFTLKKGQDASKTLRQLFDVRSGATNQALNETLGRVYIDFEDYLKEKDATLDNEIKTETQESNVERQSLF
ncbi:COP23 domain-containing protein [Geminocystis herdmanii]|uniref:COP23 domain-containing protein n=1 Tax=Geminocystis herdmanii TaxID=669359 RepID=UPI00034DCE34|nr:COP23 domain-containing protein [Geminocystis herdmanii]